MKTKSYYANSIDAAIRQAREELGSDAMLIESHAASADGRYRGRFEVVFGVPENGQEQHAAKRLAAVPAREEVAAELKMLRAQIDELRKTIQASQPHATGFPEVEEICLELVAADVAPEIAANLADTAKTIWLNPATPQIRPGAPKAGAPKECLRQIVEECVRRRIETVPNPGAAGASGGVAIAFVGPPGGGKTTTLAKIAIKHSLAERLPVRIISVETDRVGSHERLRAYAAIMGVGFVAVNSISELLQALKKEREKETVLIDTPGFTPSEQESARDIARVLDRIDGRQIHLVLPASMKRADSSAYADQFAIFNPSCLLFTKLDETSSAGSIVSEALRLGKPLSFFSTGQGVPEDLENAAVETLIGRLFPEMAAPAASAA
jgi:flagellar biosynthesis protein FlhF